MTARQAREIPSELESPICVSKAAELTRLCERWRSKQALAVDTEFVRERTFFPGLGLIQIGDGDACYLIDPLKIEDLEDLKGILLDPSIDKVLHSCAEDLEVLYHRFGVMPRSLFDTQIAAAFLGYGRSLGYGRLVQELFDIELPKGQTRTNWMRRPLTEAQKRYAALDVAYLLPAYEILQPELRRQDRERWMHEDLEELRDTQRFLPAPETIFRRFRQARGMSRRELAVLRDLGAWREHEARRRDLPRNFVLRESALPKLARRRPQSLRDLRQSRLLDAQELRHHGRTLVNLVVQAAALPPESLPAPEELAVDLAHHRKEVKRLQDIVSIVARDLGLPEDLLASRRTLESLMRRVLAGKQPPFPPELRGWRQHVVGNKLLAEVRTLRAAALATGRPPPNDPSKRADASAYRPPTPNHREE